MLKRFALMVAATAVLAIPASSAFGAPAPQKPTGLAPPEACFAAYPEAVQPALCGEGKGGPGGH
jgi:hypothetical protein